MDSQTLEARAELICGDDQSQYPIYRTGSELSRFFSNAGIPRFQHDGSTRKWWTLEALNACTPEELTNVIKRVASPREYRGNQEQVKKAVKAVNQVLALEGYKVTLDGADTKLERSKVDFDIEEQEEELKPLPPPDFMVLGLEPGIGELLERRWNEAQVCLDKGAYLSATVMMGSLLEGMLLGVMQKNPQIANRCLIAPKDVDTGKVKQFANWSLSEMIDVAHAVGWLDFDVKRFSHVLREFRNLIHPYHQMVTRANPDEDTCSIIWPVVTAAANDLARVLEDRKG